MLIKKLITVISSALSNMNKELAAIGLPLEASPQMTSQAQSSPPAGSIASGSGSIYQTSPDPYRSLPVISHPVFQPSFSHNIGPDAMSIEPGVFETMSTLQPLSIRVGAIQGSENRAPNG